MAGLYAQGLTRDQLQVGVCVFVCVLLCACLSIGVGECR